ncbi:MAG TPA: acyltransferase [Vicinamibacterales bacterium]|nr:acyltransferase [Vicinamibacterales bacterium]
MERKQLSAQGNVVAYKENAGHIPALDGVRGLAILAVLTYHAARGLPYAGSHEQIVQGLLGMGWIGVDLFFVLSGFLITGILLDAKGSPAYFRTFYARRVLRIFPLYLIFVACATVIAPAVGVTTLADASRLRAAQPWYWTYLVNAMIARHGWSAAAWHTGHLWSLSVEEQFYIAWPVVVMATSRRTLIRSALAIEIAAIACRAFVVAAYGPSTAVYVLLPTRVDGLVLGAVSAALARDAGAWRRLQRWTAPVAVAAVATLVAVYRRDLLEPEGALTQIAGYPALALLGGTMIVGAVSAPAGRAQARLWTHPVLRFFGRYSYGMYVWHQLVIWWLGTSVLPSRRLPLVAGSHLPGNALFVLSAYALTTAVALVSWRVVESPFLRLKRFVTYGKPGRYRAGLMRSFTSSV